eukprot:749681-Hanusia_phi.AAC.2
MLVLVLVLFIVPPPPSSSAPRMHPPAVDRRRIQREKRKELKQLRKSQSAEDCDYLYNSKVMSGEIPKTFLLLLRFPSFFLYNH